MTSAASTSALRRVLPRTPLARLLATTAGLAVVLQLVTHWLVAADGPVVDLAPRLPWAGGPALLGALLVLTVLGDQLSVPLRHGEQTEHLTFFEAALLLDVTLLPAGRALSVALLVVVFRDVVRRRPFVKAVFNVSMLATGAATLVLVVHLLTTPAAGLGARTVLALTAGTVAFAAVNLLHLSRLLAVVAQADPWRLVVDEARLSTVMALGNVALAGTVLAVATAAPAMLPFTVMPAAALLFAYRAAAQEAEERERSTGLLELSRLLAGHGGDGDLLAGSLELVRQVFRADVALAVLDGDPTAPAGGALCVLDDRLAGPSSRAATAEETALLRHASASGASALAADLPTGWTRALVAPLEAEGRRLGAVVLAVRDRDRPLGARELTLLTPTASALAVALRGVEHLRRVEEETGKLQAVVDSSSDGILVLDGAGTVQLWSPAVEALTGRASAQALGCALAGLLVTRGADGLPCDAFLVGRDQLSPQAPQATVEVTVVRSDGEERVVRCAFAGVFLDGEGGGSDGELSRVVVIVHDVTRERQVERLKADFIATVSHELRTPVTPIRGYADLLRRRGDRMTPEKRREVLDVIVDRADHLSRLVEDLLLASRISAKEGESAAHVEMGRDDLGALTRRACADFGEGARVTTVLPDGPVPVGCDPVRVIQVLTNLVGNALKYSAPGTPVQVELVDAGGVARVEVSDRGRGIPADQVERVFEKFHRVEDPMQMTTGGTGLGLYIARQLATAMGGTLDCTSTLGVGSVFRFSLPVTTAPVVAETGAPGPGTSGPFASGPGASGPGAPEPRGPGAAVPVPVPVGASASGFPVSVGVPSTGQPVTDPSPARQGRRTPPWAVPPPRPASAAEQAGPQRLG